MSLVCKGGFVLNRFYKFFLIMMYFWHIQCFLLYLMQGTDGVYLAVSSEYIKLRFVGHKRLNNLLLSKKIDYCCIFFLQVL